MDSSLVIKNLYLRIPDNYMEQYGGISICVRPISTYPGKKAPMILQLNYSHRKLTTQRTNPIFLPSKQARTREQKHPHQITCTTPFKSCLRSRFKSTSLHSSIYKISLLLKYRLPIQVAIPYHKSSPTRNHLTILSHNLPNPRQTCHKLPPDKA